MWYSSTGKWRIVINGLPKQAGFTIAFVTRVATVDQNSPLWLPAMGSKTHMEYMQEKLKLLQGIGSLLRHQISAIHNKRHCSLACKEP